MRAFTLSFNLAGALKDESGLPFACVVQPFAKAEDAPLSKPSAVRAKEVGRCRHCYACATPHTCKFRTLRSACWQVIWLQQVKL